MSGVAWLLAAVLLATAAGVAAWPAGAVLRRLNSRRQRSLRVVTVADLRRVWSRTPALADGPPRRAVGLAVLSGAVVGTLMGGLVGGLVLAVYGALGARAAVRRAARRRAAVARSRSLDDLNALAADLRAGLAIGPLPSTPGSATGARSAGALPQESRDRVGELRDSGPGTAVGDTRMLDNLDPRLGELTAAVWRLAEQTGAPAADLVERIEADARASDRSRATAAAQAAGAQATALLLAALPIGGIGLGYGIGVDPLRVLLHTPLGAACATAAVLLQCGGLLWADRLSNGPTPEGPTANAPTANRRTPGGPTPRAHVLGGQPSGGPVPGEPAVDRSAGDQSTATGLTLGALTPGGPR